MEVLAALLQVFLTYGRPRAIRTDTEGLFVSWKLRLALRLLGVRHQRTDPYCPWQNGRVERVFRTLKEKLRLYWATAGKPHLHVLDVYDGLAT